MHHHFLHPCPSDSLNPPLFTIYSDNKIFGTWLQGFSPIRWHEDGVLGHPKANACTVVEMRAVCRPLKFFFMKKRKDSL